MSGYSSVGHYSAALVAACGVGYWLGLVGIGLALLRGCRGLRIRLGAPWKEVIAFLLGIQSESLVVQLLAMAGVAKPAVLCTVCLCVLGSGAAVAFRIIAGVRLVKVREACTRRAFPFLTAAIAATMVSLNFLVACAPATKIDELHYHLLLPSRIALDGALDFYCEPFLASIWPQMHYQISLTPLHAIGVPDAGNVVSWSTGLLLAWFGGKMVALRTGNLKWAWLFPAALFSGLYTSVWHVTGGAHSVGDLATAATFVGWFDTGGLRRQVRSTTYVGLVSFLALNMATTKISLLPLAAMLLCWAVLYAWRRGGEGGISFCLIVASVTPWLLFYAPLAWWTFVKSGSPLGPVLSGLVTSSPYDTESIRVAQYELIGFRKQTLPFFMLYTTCSYTPLVGIGAISLFVCRAVSGLARLAAGSLFVLQLLIMLYLVPFDIRFLGGLHYGAALLAAMNAAQGVVRFAVSRWGVGLLACALLPWNAIQVYYGRPFIAVATGLRAKDAFLERFVPMYRDLAALDKVLPSDAILLAEEYPRFPGFYSPRRVLYLPRQGVVTGSNVPPSQRRIYVLTTGCTELSFPKGWEDRGVVYENTQSVVLVYRAFRAPNVLGHLRVHELQRTECLPFTSGSPTGPSSETLGGGDDGGKRRSSSPGNKS